MRGPIAGPVASSAIGQSSRTLAASPELRAAKDDLSVRPSRITSHQLQIISSHLTDRDWQVLDFVAGSRLASGKQLAAGLWNADRHRSPGRARIARRALKRLADWRVLDPLPARTVGGLHGGSDTIIYGVGVAGVRLLAQRGQHQKRLGTPGARYVAHTLGCTGLVVELRMAAARGELEVIETQQEPRCWRTFMAGMGARLTLKPDLYLRIAAPGSEYEHRWVVEIDMATEASTTIRSKATRHLAYYRSGGEPVHPRVLWAVPDARRAEQITDALAGLPTPAERLFAVCLLGEAVGFLAREARS